MNKRILLDYIKRNNNDVDSSINGIMISKKDAAGDDYLGEYFNSFSSDNKLLYISSRYSPTKDSFSVFDEKL